MQSLGLSNIQLRSNLLSVDYQQEMSRITAFEIENIWDRNPSLRNPHALDEKQQKQLRDSLFWGDRRVTLDDDDRRRAWGESLAERVEPTLECLESRPTLENAYELLVVTGQLCRADLNSIYRDKAIEWHQRVRAVLARDEFRLTPEMIDQRLSQFLDLSIAAVAVAPPPPPVGDEHQATLSEISHIESVSVPSNDESVLQSDLQGTSSAPSDSNSRETDVTDGDPRLVQLISEWPCLSEPIKASIFALLVGVEQAERT